MKIQRFTIMNSRLCLATLALFLTGFSPGLASGQGVWGISAPIFAPGPGWGQGWRPVWINRSQPSLLGKVSVAADYNYDGEVNGKDKYVERGLTEGPLGLIIGTNEMAKVELTCVPTPTPKVRIGEPKIKMKYYKLALILSIEGVNLAKKNGKFKTMEDEFASCGRILVWSDQTRQELLLDSSDVSKRTLMWPYSESVPLPHIYVEAVEPAQPGNAHVITWELDDSYGQNGFQRAFGEPAVWDRIMVTAHPTGIEKPFKDTSPAWVQFGRSGSYPSFTSSK